MDSEQASSLTKMDKIQIVVEYNELLEQKKAEFLEQKGIDEETLKAYQQEAALVLGISIDSAPPRPKTRCEELIEELRHDNENVRRDAVRELGSMRHKATSAVDALIDRMLNDSIDFVRSWSAWALTRVEPRSPKVIEGFLQSLAEDEHSINARNWCIVGLSVAESDHAQNRLVKIVHTGEPFAQFAAIEALTRMNVDSSEFIEGLKIAAGSYNESLKQLAKDELCRIQDKD